MDNLPLEIIHTILLYVPYPDLLNYRLLNRNTYHIVQDCSLWMRKLDYDFALHKKLPSTYVLNYSIQPILWHITYKCWYNHPPPQYEPYVMFQLDTLNIDCERLQEMYVVALQHSSHNVIKKLYSISDFAQHLIKINDEPEFLRNIEITTLNELARNTQLNYNMCTRYAAIFARIDILEWLFEKGTFSNEHALKGALRSTYTTSIEWLIHRDIRPNQELINGVVYNWTFEMAQWLWEHDMVPSAETADINLTMHDLRKAQWLYDHSVYPTQECLYQCIFQGNLEILDWLWEHDIKPNNDACYYAIQSNIVHTLQWLSDHGIIPDTGHANFALACKQWNALEWMIRRNIRPVITDLKDMIPDSILKLL